MSNCIKKGSLVKVKDSILFKDEIGEVKGISTKRGKEIEFRVYFHNSVTSGYFKESELELAHI